MKIAITVWGNRVSPVFDSACTLLITEIKNARVVSKMYQHVNPDRPMQLVQMLFSQGVVALICGAVSERPAHIMESAGLQLIPFITGDIETVLKTCLESNPVWAKLKMPGCGRRVCRRNRKRIEHEFHTGAALKKTGQTESTQSYKND